MCSIAGFASSSEDYKRGEGYFFRILENMNEALKLRGPDDSGIKLYSTCGLAQNRLAIIDLVTGHQPMTKKWESKECTIAYNGEIYNMKELKDELKKKGMGFTTASDTEVVLSGFMMEGEGFVRKLNGIFAMAIWDENQKKLFLFRDRMGVKPLFYTLQNQTLIFASELKGLFAHPFVTPEIDMEGMSKIFALGPAKTPGDGVFKNIKEVLPGHRIVFSKGEFKEGAYWKLVSSPHEDSYAETVEKTRFLLEDAVCRQMISDVPISTFLSGGVDSSLVTAICAKELKKSNQKLRTYSFDFQENEQYFKSNSFQPSQDRPWVDKMKEFADTDHIYLECNNTQQIDYLFKTVDARDLPCMADVESSLLYFCSQVAGYNKVAMTGECADEIFGGYPWCYQKEASENQDFPWSTDMEARKVLLCDDAISALKLDECSRKAYDNSIAQTPRLHGEGGKESRQREIAWLNLSWFMVTLLDRMDRTSMYSGLEARVPFADYRIVEYIWNVPWNMKCPNGMVKGLLREASRGLLPDEVLFRKKSPYPKTYHPEYERLLGEKLLEVVTDVKAPIRGLIDVSKVETFVSSPSDYGKPWYGQLMAGPQMMAYMLQVNYWMDKYKLSF